MQDYSLFFYILLFAIIIGGLVLAIRGKKRNDRV